MKNLFLVILFFVSLISCDERKDTEKDVQKLISKKIKLKKVTSKNQIIKCQLPPKYLTEENPYLSETFTFGLVKPELKYIDGLFKLDLVVEENFVRIFPPKNSNFYLPDSSARI